MREPSLTNDKFLLQLIKHFGTPTKVKDIPNHRKSYEFILGEYLIFDSIDQSTNVKSRITKKLRN